MMYAALFIFLIILCYWTFTYFDTENCSVMKVFIEANNLFCVQYFLFSCFFIFIEKFSVLKPLIAILFFDSFTLILLKVKKITQSKVIYSISKNEWIMLTLSILAIPLIYITAEDIGTISDQGTYFLYSTVYMEEKSNSIHTLEEMGVISENVDEGLRELQNELLIYYHEDGEDYYYLHALGTWCSLLALFGKMFGIWNCMKAVNYLYLLIVWNMLYLCQKIAANKNNIYMAWGMFAFSPLILYIGKAGLAEAAILLLFLVGLRYILENKKIFYLLAGINIGLIGFIHISMVMYMPIVTFIAALESVKRSKKNIAIFNTIQLMMFGVSLWYIYKISTIYVEKQYSRFTLQEKLNYTTIFIGIDILVVLLIIYQIKVYQNEKDFMLSFVRENLYKYFKLIAFIALTAIICRTIYYAYFLCFTDKFAIVDGYDAGTWNLRSRYVNTGLTAISYLNIVNIARATGVIGLFVFLILPFINKNITERSITFYYMGLYGIIIYTVLMMDTPSNYYSSRYFVPFVVPMIVISLISAVESKSWSIYILMLALLFNRYYWPAFLRGGPQVGQYELLQDAIATIPNNAIVFCNPESQTTNVRLTAGLRILNDNEVYNLKNYVEVMDYYSGLDSYIISETKIEQYHEPVLYNVYLSQYSFGNGPNGSYDTNVGTYQIPLFIYKMESN